MKKITKPFGEFGKLATQYDTFRPSYPKKAISFIYNTIGVKQPNILDLGCGTGISTRQLAKNKGLIVGYDADKQMLKVASQQNQNQSNITYRNGRVEKLPFENNSFDGVTAFIAFHWFMNKKAISEIKRVLKQDGTLCIVQPRFASFQKDFRIILEKELNLKILKNYKISKEIMPFLTENGFRVKKRIFESDTKYTLSGYLSLLKSYSLWNYVPANQQQEIEELLKKHFKTKLRSGYIRNIRYVEVVIAVKMKGSYNDKK